MKGDFSRDAFNPHKHFSRVLQQQGRVQLDADTNEQTAILLHYLRTLAADLIGPYARPAGSDGGFKITKCDDGNLSISAGRYYVDGILCENEEDTTTYKDQPDYPNPPDLPANRPYMVYLDVWEQHITALEDDDIREKALGGPDTATRTKVIWQVKVDAWDSSCSIPESCAEMDGEWKNKWVNRWQPENRGLLRARVRPSENSTEPCLTAPDAKYRGQENQLYRIEIHQGGKAKKEENDPACATFKWSRDNGSVVSRVVEFFGTELVVEKPQGFEAGIWVELVSDAQELRGEPGSLVKLIKVDGDRFTLESPVPESCAKAGQPAKIKIRRWDHYGNGNLKLEKGAVPVTEAENGETEGWIEIENGIEIRFVPACKGDHCYRTGDYWLIPARVATGNIEWPESDGQGVPPLGIEHHYAPLAIIKAEDSCDNLCREFKPQFTTC